MLAVTSAAEGQQLREAELRPHLSLYTFHLKRLVLRLDGI